MKYLELKKFLDNFSVVGSLTGEKFIFALVKNKRLAEQELKHLEEKSKPSDDFAKFDKKRIELLEKYCKRHPNGRPVIESGNFVMEQQASFDADYKKLSEDNKDIIKEQEEQIKWFNNEIENGEAVNFKPLRIDARLLPNDITADQLDLIFFMINSEE